MILLDFKVLNVFIMFSLAIRNGGEVFGSMV